MQYLEDEFGDIIAKARSGHHISLEALAQRTGISLAALREMENYALKPTTEQVATLSRELRLNAANLAAIAEESWLPAPWDAAADPVSEVLQWQMPVGAYSVYCYGLRCRRTGEFVVVDTGGQGQRLASELAKQNLRPRYLLMTHDHGDHAGGLDALRKATGAEVLAGAAANIPRARKLQAEESIPFGESTIRAFATPGHTAGCMSYHIGSTAFVGDTIFAGSIGRANDSYEALLESVYEKVLNLDDSVRLFPGHGSPTTVGEEKRHNPFVVL